MSYREKIKGTDEFTILLSRLEIVRDVLVHGIPRIEVAAKNKTHRNTITNIIKLFKTRICKENQAYLLSCKKLSRFDIMTRFKGLNPLSRAPKRHPAMATKNQEDIIVDLHQKLGYGVERMASDVTRTLDQADGRNAIIKKLKLVQDLTIPQIRGIYKRRKLKAPTKKTGSKQRRKLYDYDQIAAFEHLHHDTKTITDLKSLPLEVYKKFKSNPELPVVEWNIIDAATRFRFIAYSHGRTSEFGFHFLICVLQFIRAMFPCMRDMPISIGADNGSEFCLGSDEKLKDWNRALKFLNANFWVYKPNWDIRKNLIERSHRTDDEESSLPKDHLSRIKLPFLMKLVGTLFTTMPLEVIAD